MAVGEDMMMTLRGYSMYGGGVMWLNEASEGGSRTREDYVGAVGLLSLGALQGVLGYTRFTFAYRVF